MTNFASNHTSTIIERLLNNILEQVWNGVGMKNAEKMAPALTVEQFGWTIDVFAHMAFTEQYGGIQKLAAEKDPVPAKMDTFAAGNIDVEDKQSKDEQKLVKQSEKVKTFVSELSISKKSVQSGKFQKSFQQKKSMEGQQNKSIDAQNNQKQSFLISLSLPEEATDTKVQNMRKAENDRLAQQLKLQKIHNQRKKIMQKNALQNQKLIKEKKPFTFDYEGLYHGINPGKLPLETVRKMKDHLGNSGVNGKQKIKLQPTPIINQKNKERDAKNNAKNNQKQLPVFSEKSFSIAQALNDPNSISEGIKITELRGNNNNVVRQHKTKKLEGVKQYRLKEYKDLSKQKSFKEFPKSLSKKSSLLDLSISQTQNKEDIPSKTLSKLDRLTHKSGGKSERQIRAMDGHMVLEQALGRNLPFIRTKGLRFNDLGSTFKTLQINMNNTDRKSSKPRSSRIHISDTLLYQQSFLD